MVSHCVQSALADTATGNTGLASPAGHRAKCLLWSGQQELQVLSKFGCNIILWLSVPVGLVRALKILPGSYKLSVHAEMIEIKRAFWRYLVQLPVQAESPRSRLLRNTHRWLLAISKNGYSIVSLGNLFQCSLPLTVKNCLLMDRMLWINSSFSLANTSVLSPVVTVCSMLN